MVVSGAGPVVRQERNEGRDISGVGYAIEDKTLKKVLSEADGLLHVL